MVAVLAAPYTLKSFFRFDVLFSKMPPPLLEDKLTGLAEFRVGLRQAMESCPCLALLRCCLEVT